MSNLTKEQKKEIREKVAQAELLLAEALTKVYEADPKETGYGILAYLLAQEQAKLEDIMRRFL